MNIIIAGAGEVGYHLAKQLSREKHYITVIDLDSSKLEKIDSVMGSVVTSFGNVGPAPGTVGPTDNFSHIHDVGKWELSFLMLFGRLELFTIIVIFSPTYWKS